MGLFSKKPDPITDRSRELTSQIAALESKIKKLNQELQPGAKSRPRAAASPFAGEAPESEQPEAEPAS